MRFGIMLLIASSVDSSTVPPETPPDCSVYRGLNITWKVRSFSNRLFEDALNFGLRFRHGQIDLPVFYHNDSGQPIPEEFDARKKWPNCESIKEIRYQGHCGSCWAVASASVMSDRICIHSNGKDQVRISALDLLSCCEECSDATGGCKGGYRTPAFRYWETTGIVSGGEVRHSQTDVSMIFI
nr:unnamed protein product [Callosobruchus analis]